MLGVYLFATVVGGGLLLLSLLGGGDGHGDVDAQADVDAHVDAGGADHDAGVDADHPGVTQLVLGFFRPRNFVFGTAAFGLTGSVLTLVGAHPAFTLLAAAGLGVGFFFLSHGVFALLRRSEAAIAPVSDTQLLGERARVTLDLQPGQPGRIACLLGGREVHLVARLGPQAEAAVPAGATVIVTQVVDGTAEVLPPDLYDRLLPP